MFDAANSLVDPDPELAQAIVETAPTQAADGHFTPGAWNMWASWLDGGIDLKLYHNSDNTDTTPLVPIAAVPAGEVPASEAGLMRVAASAAGTAADAATGFSAASAPLAPDHTASAADIAALPRDAAEPQADDVRVHLAPRSTTPPEAELFATESEADGRVYFAMTRESPAAARDRRPASGYLRPEPARRHARARAEGAAVELREHPRWPDRRSN
ncbi:MAG: hypothetical protein VB142_08815 [Burkholderia sp.]